MHVTESDSSGGPRANDSVVGSAVGHLDDSAADEVLDEQPEGEELGDTLGRRMIAPERRRKRSELIAKMRGRLNVVRSQAKEPPAIPPVRFATEERDAQRLERLRESHERIKALAFDARAARVRDAAAYAGPVVPREDARRHLLLDAVRRSSRSHVSGAPAGLVTKMDANVARIARDVVENPLWIAADYLERNTVLESVTSKIDNDGRLRAADRAYARAEEALLAAKRGLDEYEQRQHPWLKRAEKLLPKAWGKGERLRARMTATAEDVVYGKVERDATEANVRAELEVIVGDSNVAALAKQQEASTQRDHVERQLRAALMERHVASQLWGTERVVGHLRDAPAHESLEYAGISRIGPYRVHEFQGASQTYLADSVETQRFAQSVDLARGDKVVRRDAVGGELSLEVSQRGDVWSGARSIAGELVEIDRAGQTVRGLKLRDGASGKSKWVRPREGSDLGKELSPPLLEALVVGDTIHIEGRSMFVRQASVRGHGR